MKLLKRLLNGLLMMVGLLVLSVVVGVLLSLPDLKRYLKTRRM